MQENQHDIFTILMAEKSAAEARLAQAWIVRAREPKNLEAITDARHAQWAADAAQRKLSEFGERRYQDNQRYKKYLDYSAKQLTNKILTYILVPTFFISGGLGPFFSLLWSKDFRALSSFALNNEFANIALLLFNFGWALFVVWGLEKLLHPPIYAKIIAAKTRAPRP